MVFMKSSQMVLNGEIKVALEVRSGLYMATLAAIRCNPAIKGFYQRLIAAGKCHKVAATACMRKLLMIANAMLRDQTLWQQN